MTNQDDNNQKIEKVEDVEVETTKKTSDSDDKKQNDDASVFKAARQVYRR